MPSINSIVRRAALCALVLFGTVPAQAATPNAQQLAAYEQISETERIKLLMGLAKSAEADQVTYLLKKYPLQGPYAINRILYLEGTRHTFCDCSCTQRILYLEGTPPPHP